MCGQRNRTRSRNSRYRDCTSSHRFLRTPCHALASQRLPATPLPSYGRIFSTPHHEHPSRNHAGSF
ncbi:hypothetical protein EVA_02933 [gut metagenome]|uniref:Uncharacterized protein n=1 Tax=gut metagenome TaxID=749906 RepID=J9H024_9ZZZZ